MQRQVVGYARVNNAGDEVNLDGQITCLRNAGAVEILTDIQSGVSRERVGLNRLLELVQAKQVDEVLITRVDRLSRSLVQLQEILGLCRDQGVVITFLDQKASVS